MHICTHCNYAYEQIDRQTDRQTVTDTDREKDESRTRGAGD